MKFYTALQALEYLHLKVKVHYIKILTRQYKIKHMSVLTNRYSFKKNNGNKSWYLYLSTIWGRLQRQVNFMTFATLSKSNMLQILWFQISGNRHVMQVGIPWVNLMMYNIQHIDFHNLWGYKILLLTSKCFSLLEMTYI